MTAPTVRIHRIDWNGNDGEIWYAGEAVNYLRALLGRFGFHVGMPLTRPGALRVLSVVKPGCSLTELQDVCRDDPGVEITPCEG